MPGRNSVFTVRIPTTYEAFPCTRCCARAFPSHHRSGLTADAAACCAETQLSSTPHEAPSIALSFPSVLMGKLRLLSHPQAPEGHGQGAKVEAREPRSPSARKSAGCWGREEVGALAFIPEVPTRVLTSTTGSSDKPLHMTAPEPFTKTAVSTCRPTPAKGVRVDGAAPASVTCPASLQPRPAAGTTKPLLSPRRIHAALSTCTSGLSPG